jgi:hypothetical protein
MTIITCDCGELEVHFATTKPLLRLVCCCNDCNAVLHWAAWKSGRTFYPASQGIDKIYLENSLKIVQGEERLRWVKITPETLCLRGVTTCCYSSLFVENLSILGPKIVCVDVDFCKVKGAEICEVTAQIFEKDVPVNRKNAVCAGFNGRVLKRGLRTHLDGRTSYLRSTEHKPTNAFFQRDLDRFEMSFKNRSTNMVG